MFRCFIWSKTDVLWKNADWQWSKCKEIPEPPITPPIIMGGVDASLLVPPWQQETYLPYSASIVSINAKKNKKLIKLMCKIRGEEYNEEKETKSVDLGVDDITLRKTEKVINLNLKLKE